MDSSSTGGSKLVAPGGGSPGGWPPVGGAGGKSGGLSTSIGLNGLGKSGREFAVSPQKTTNDHFCGLNPSRSLSCATEAQHKFLRASLFFHMTTKDGPGYRAILPSVPRRIVQQWNSCRGKYFSLKYLTNSNILLIHEVDEVPSGISEPRGNALTAFMNCLMYQSVTGEGFAWTRSSMVSNAWAVPTLQQCENVPDQSIKAFRSSSVLSS